MILVPCVTYVLAFANYMIIQKVDPPSISIGLPMLVHCVTDVLVFVKYMIIQKVHLPTILTSPPPPMLVQCVTRVLAFVKYMIIKKSASVNHFTYSPMLVPCVTDVLAFANYMIIQKVDPPTISLRFPNICLICNIWPNINQKMDFVKLVYVVSL